MVEISFTFTLNEACTTTCHIFRIGENGEQAKRLDEAISKSDNELIDESERWWNSS